MSTYYSVLGISMSANNREISSAYKRLMLLEHPDRSKHPQALQRAQLINEAYSVLSDPAKRTEYDLWVGDLTGNRVANSQDYVAGSWGRRRPDWSTESKSNNASARTEDRPPTQRNAATRARSYGYSSTRVEPETPSITLLELWVYFRIQVLFWIGVLLAGVVIFYFELEIMLGVFSFGLLGFYLLAKLGYFQAYSFVFRQLLEFVSAIGCLILLILVPAIFAWDFFT